MSTKPELSQELNVFLELLHQQQDYQVYENYLLGGDLEDCKHYNGIKKDLSIIYSQPESEASTQRDNYSIGDVFQLIFRDIDMQREDLLQTLPSRLKQLQQQIHNYMLRVQEKMIELQSQNQSVEENNKLLIEALNSAQQEIQMLGQTHEENINKLKKNIQDLKKQCVFSYTNQDELHKSLNQAQVVNSNLISQIEQQSQNYKLNEDEFREASQRLIKSNQALREIIVNMGNISPLHKSKLQEVIKYLTNDTNTRSGRSQSRKQKENNSLHYSTLNSSRKKKSMSPTGFNSTRKQLGINVLDTNYQTSYKELFLKSLKVQKQK